MRDHAANFAGARFLDGVLKHGQGNWFKATSNALLPLFKPAPCDLETWDTVLSGGLDVQPEVFGLADGLATGKSDPRQPVTALSYWQRLMRIEL